ATLAPTFRLRYDQPGQSYALTVAARLGLGPELIARAQAHRSEHTARLSELLATLDAHARTEAARAREIERARADAAVPLAPGSGQRGRRYRRAPRNVSQWWARCGLLPEAPRQSSPVG